MKKLVVLLSLVMALALAAPAFAGINTDISGSITGQIRWDAQDGVTTNGETKASITMTAGSEGDIKAVVNLGASTANPKGPFGGPGGSPFIGSNNVVLNITSAWIEARGPWIKGGPGVVTRIGSLTPSYHDWVAHFVSDRTGKRIDAFEISEAVIGPISLTGLAAWYYDGVDADTHRVNSLSAKGNLDVVDLQVAVTREVEGDGTPVSTDYAVTAGVSPVDGISINATYATHGATATSAYKVGGEIATIPGVKLGASTWSADAGFHPEWARHTDNEEAKATTAFTSDQKGFEVTASTSQSGVDLSASYKNVTDAAGNNPVATTVVSASTTVSDTSLSGKVTMETGVDTKIEASASRSFGNVNGSYKLTAQSGNIDHEIAADTTVDTPLADAVKLEGKVILDAAPGDGIGTKFGFDATWTNPIGVKLGLGYANYDRTDKWPGGYNVTNDGNGADGFVAHASYMLDF